MVCMTYGKGKKGNKWVLRDNVKRFNVLHKCQNNVLHLYTDSHLVMYGVVHRLFNIQNSHVLHLLKASIKHIRQSNSNIQYTVSINQYTVSKWHGHL